MQEHGNVRITAILEFAPRPATEQHGAAYRISNGDPVEKSAHRL